MPSLKLNALSRRHFLNHTFITRLLRLLWVLSILIGELGIFYWSISGCKWPAIDTGVNPPTQPSTSHILLVADPQIQHPSLISARSWWSQPLRRILFELNLRKSWHVTKRRTQPDAVIFMGDMLANGKVAESFEQYDQAVQKFKSIFSVDPSTEVYYVPGNNDVGLASPSTSRSLRSYYLKSFRPLAHASQTPNLNYAFTILNHTFIALDAPALLDEDYLRHGNGVSFDEWKPLSGGSVEFVKSLRETSLSNPILLTHIPLSRSETAPCGPLRERGSMRRGAGQGWQSMLGKQTSRWVLEMIRPGVVFSADNRDYCEHHHNLPPTTSSSPSGIRDNARAVREITLKSFSLSVHIRRPGFQLLTLVDPSQLSNPSIPSWKDTTCLLPDQYAIYGKLYAPLLFVSVVVLLVGNFKNLLIRGRNAPRELNFGGLSLSLGQAKTPTSPGMQSPSLWTPFAPFSPLTPLQSVSPRGKLPPHLRTPHAHSGNGGVAHFVASPRITSGMGTPGAVPGTPSFLGVPGSGMLNEKRAAYEEEDAEEDMMYPAQYANQAASLPGSRTGSRAGSRRGSFDGSDVFGAGGGGGPAWLRHPSGEGAFEDGDEEEGYDMLDDELEGGQRRPTDAEATPTHSRANSYSQTKRTRRISIPSSSSMARTVSGGGSSSSTTKTRTRTKSRWRLSKTFTFTLRGRRRKITLGFGVPTSAGLWNLLDLLGLGGTTDGGGSLTTFSSGSGSWGGIASRRGRGRRRQGPTAFLVDALSVFWPGVVVWVIINWMVL